MKYALAAFCAAAAIAVSAPSANAQEAIRSFFAGYDILKNGSVDVAELISYDFGQTPAHSIYREIPLVDAQSNYVDIRVRSVTDQDGTPQPFEVQDLKSALRIKIGSAGAASGVNTYNVQYNVKYAIRTLQDSDAFYWNVTGHQWVVPVESTAAEIRFPAGVSLSAISKACYTGKEGSRETECAFSLVTSTLPVLRVLSLRPLMAGEGMTLSVDLPKGAVGAVTLTSDELLNRLEALKRAERYSKSGTFVLGYFLFVFIGLIFMAASRMRKSRQIRPYVPVALRNKIVMPQFGPPEQMSPADVGYLIDGVYDETELLASIVELGRKGHLRVKYGGYSVGDVFSPSEWIFSKMSDGKNIDIPEEKMVFDYLFPDQKESVQLSDLSPGGPSGFIAMMREYYRKKFVSEGFAVPIGFGKKIIIKLDAFVRHALPILIILLSPVLFGIYFAFGSLPFAVFIALLLVFYMAVIRRVNCLTIKGEDALMGSLGFRQYLSATESVRAALINPPQITSTDFERNLAYALVVGAHVNWAKNFVLLMQDGPSWYDGPSQERFSPTRFASYLSDCREALAFGAARGKPRSGASR